MQGVQNLKGHPSDLNLHTFDFVPSLLPIELYRHPKIMSYYWLENHYPLAKKS